MAEASLGGAAQFEEMIRTARTMINEAARLLETATIISSSIDTAQAEIRERIRQLQTDLDNVVSNAIAALPTAPPSTPGQPWNNGGMVSIS